MPLSFTIASKISSTSFVLVSVQSTGSQCRGLLSISIVAQFGLNEITEIKAEPTELFPGRSQADS
jgi:hypothetical protein